MTLREINRLQARLEKRRKIWILTLSLVMLICLILCTWSAMRIMPFYGRWYRANHFDEHPLGYLTGPFRLEIEIRYDTEPPRDARLVDSGTGRQIYGLTEDPDRSQPGILILTGDFDDSVKPGEYILKLRPGENKSLTCQIDTLPSLKYISLTATPYRNSNNDLWLAIDAGFHNAANQSGPNITVMLTGPGYSKEVYSCKPGVPEISRTINLSALFYDLGLDLSAGNLISITANAEYKTEDDSKTSRAKKDRTLALDAWPEHDPNTGYDYNMADTDEYLARVLSEN